MYEKGVLLAEAGVGKICWVVGGVTLLKLIILITQRVLSTG